MTHAVVIRFHYEDGQKFEWRFAYFYVMVLPKLLSQKNKNFDICIWCNTKHRERFESLSDRIKVFGIDPKMEGKIKKGYEHKAKRYFVDFIEWEHVRGMPQYDIQTALDSDDLILRDDFIDYIESVFSKLKDNSPALVSFQPYIFDAKTLKTYWCPIRYSAQNGSAIYSFYQPDKENYKFVFHDSHQKMWQHAHISLFKSEGYCAFSVHGQNESTYLYRDSKQIMI